MQKIKKTIVLLLALLFISASSIMVIGCNGPAPEGPPPEEVPETPTEP